CARESVYGSSYVGFAYW
nr:immunoglobulin heavy chain junction region [Mus musculus]